MSPLPPSHRRTDAASPEELKCLLHSMLTELVLDIQCSVYNVAVRAHQGHVRQQRLVEERKKSMPQGKAAAGRGELEGSMTNGPDAVRGGGAKQSSGSQQGGTATAVPPPSPPPRAPSRGGALTAALVFRFPALDAGHVLQGLPTSWRAAKGADEVAGAEPHPEVMMAASGLGLLSAMAASPEGE